MASQSITPIEVPYVSSTTVTFTALSTSLTASFVNDGKSIAVVKNGGGSPINVTLQTVADQYGRTANTAYAIAAGAERVFAPTAPAVFNQRSGADAGKTLITTSSTASVSIAVLSIS